MGTLRLPLSTVRAQWRPQPTARAAPQWGTRRPAPPQPPTHRPRTARQRAPPSTARPPPRSTPLWTPPSTGRPPPHSTPPLTPPSMPPARHPTVKTLSIPKARQPPSTLLQLPTPRSLRTTQQVDSMVRTPPHTSRPPVSTHPTATGRH